MFGCGCCAPHATPNTCGSKVLRCRLQRAVCFPAHAPVTLASGVTKRMDELSLGESVAVRRADGSIGYEPVYAW